MRVKFNDATEFLEELEVDREQVERSIVRPTCQYTRGDLFTRVCLVATAIAVGHVVTLTARYRHAARAVLADLCPEPVIVGGAP